RRLAKAAAPDWRGILDRVRVRVAGSRKVPENLHGSRNEKRPTCQKQIQFRLSATLLQDRGKFYHVGLDIVSPSLLAPLPSSNEGKGGVCNADIDDLGNFRMTHHSRLLSHFDRARLSQSCGAHTFTPRLNAGTAPSGTATGRSGMIS